MTLYRFHEVLFSDYRLILIKESFPVIKETKCGVWIDVYGRQRFVNLSSKKRYACPTVDEAIESYKARKKRQVGILRRKLEIAEAALKLNLENESAYFGLSQL